MSSFIEKVVTMRRLQKQYYSERSPQNLQAAKKAEREVDVELERIEKEKKQQPTLFP